MATAILVAEPEGIFAGPARTYRIDPPLKDMSNGRLHNHITIYKTLLGGPRVEVVGANPNGTAIVMNPLPGTFILQHDVSLDDACTWALLTAGGYEVVPAPEEPAAEASTT